jgi:hypothetical protein
MKKNLNSRKKSEKRITYIIVTGARGIVAGIARSPHRAQPVLEYG